MIQPQTIFRVSDNSGAKKVKCIKVLGGFRKKFASVGDLVVVSVQKVKQHKKKKIIVKEGEVLKAIVVRCLVKSPRKISSKLSFRENAVVLLTHKKKPIASRVVGPVSKELRFSKFMKIASLASGLV